MLDISDHNYTAMVSQNHKAALATIRSVDSAVGFSSFLAGLIGQSTRHKMSLYRHSDLYSVNHGSAYAEAVTDTNLGSHHCRGQDLQDQVTIRNAADSHE